MLRQKNILIAAVVLALITVFCLPGFAQANVDFEVPVPEGSSLVEDRDIAMGGRQIKIKVYTAPVSSAAILGYYRSFFSQQGFQKILDKPEPELNKHLLRFKQGDAVVAIGVLNKPGINKIVIARYLQKAGQLPPEKSGVSLTELFSMVPKKEAAGKDLAAVPRPDNSIRAAFTERGDHTQLLYIAPMNAVSVVDFYKKEMEAQGWELKREVLGSEGLGAYGIAKEDAFTPENPILERPGHKQVIQEMSILEFSADFGDAEITILPDPSQAPAGSVIKIEYDEK
ncbi:MAG: hypothetical protein WC532_08800 [Candidatus Omnitrophota bacterium]